MKSPGMGDLLLTPLVRLAVQCVTELQPRLGPETEEFVEYAKNMFAYLTVLAITSSREEWVALREMILLKTSSPVTPIAIC
jgi:hypothetical protein